MKKQRAHSLSLRQILVMAFMGVCFLLGGTSLFVLRHITNVSRESLLNAQQNYAQSVSDAMGAQFYERYGDVQAFAMNPDIKVSDKSKIVSALNAYVALYGIYDLILLVDAKGHFVASNDKNIKGEPIKSDVLAKEDFSQAEWFKKTMAGEFTEDAKKAFLGTHVENFNVDPYVSAAYGEKRLGNSFSTQVKDANGKVMGVISNRAGSRWIEVALSEVYEALKIQNLHQSTLAIFGKDGMLLTGLRGDDTGVATFEFSKSKTLDTNLKTLRVTSVLDAIEKNKPGSIQEMDPTSKTKVVTGYSFANGPKIVDSLGWYAKVSSSENEAFADLNKATRIFWGIFSIVILFTVFASIYLSGKLSSMIADLAKKLGHEAIEIENASNSIAGASTELSEATTQQAASIQETAASIDEVSAMVKRNSESAASSKLASNQSRESAQMGQSAMEQVSSAIGEISDNNEKIIKQVMDGNEKISKIADLIAEIELKTKVINDIVFQTKLLSFNASVEAARAGEHGKGFAVVAEEVGNLAQMSGNAAKEISAMLTSSIERVHSIINETKTSIQSIVQEGKQKIEMGRTLADECSGSIEKILASVSQTDSMINEISTASQEQSQGVEEINKAINQLDQAAQQNSSVSQQTASSAEQLKAQSESLKQLVHALFTIVEGSSSKADPMHTEKQVPAVVKEKKERHASHPEAKVLSMVKKEKPVALRVEKAKAVGGDVPSSDDSRFEDI